MVSFSSSLLFKELDLFFNSFSSLEYSSLSSSISESLLFNDRFDSLDLFFNSSSSLEYSYLSYSISESLVFNDKFNSLDLFT